MKPALNTEELLLVYRFRKLDKKTQSCVKSFMRGLLETEPKRKNRPCAANTETAKIKIN